MYVAPQLNRAGDTREVVLGFVQVGSDLDDTWIIRGMDDMPDYPFDFQGDESAPISE